MVFQGFHENFPWNLFFIFEAVFDTLSVHLQVNWHTFSHVVFIWLQLMSVGPPSIHPRGVLVKRISSKHHIYCCQGGNVLILGVVGFVQWAAMSSVGAVTSQVSTAGC